MGVYMNLIAWYYMLTIMLSGFIVAYGIVALAAGFGRKVHFISLMNEHFPKALPISNLFFIVSQIAAEFMGKGYLYSLREEITGSFLLSIFTLLNIALLGMLFMKQGKHFERLSTAAGILIMLIFLAQNIREGMDFLKVYLPLYGESVTWFLLLGALIALSEWVREQRKKKQPEQSPGRPEKG